MIQTLQAKSDLAEARRRLRERGLDFTGGWRLLPWRLMYLFRFVKRPPFPDIVKSWDVDRAADLITRLVPDRDAPVLDMGCFNSEILYVLHASGYRNLHGCDLDAGCRWMGFWNRI